MRQFKKSAKGSPKKHMSKSPEKKRVTSTPEPKLKKKLNKSGNQKVQVVLPTGNQRSQVVSKSAGSDRSQVVSTTGKKSARVGVGKSSDKGVGKGKLPETQASPENEASRLCQSIRCLDVSESFMALSMEYSPDVPVYHVLDKAHCLMFSSVSTENKAIQCLHNIENKYGSSSGTLRDVTNHLLNIERTYTSSRKIRLEIKDYLETNHDILKVTGKLQSYVESLPKAPPVKRKILAAKKTKPVPKPQVEPQKKRKIIKRK